MTGTARRPAGLPLRPLSTRSVVLSLLLGSHPPQLPVRDLVRGVEPFGVAEPTVRVALSRMLASGDLRRTGTTYRLSERLLERQRRQDDAIHPRTVAWRGGWEMAVVTATGRGPAERARLRAELAELRLAELREGVWLRPANLRRGWPEHLAPLVQRFTARPEQLTPLAEVGATRPGTPAGGLAGMLWALDGWAETGSGLLARLASATLPAERFTVAAAIVRHLLTDPVLPDELLSPHWPGRPLRAAYAGYQKEVHRLVRSAVR